MITIKNWKAKQKSSTNIEMTAALLHLQHILWIIEQQIIPNILISTTSDTHLFSIGYRPL